MSAADITPQVKQQDDDLADDGLDIPGFLKITAVDRHHAWNRHPPTPVPAFGREMTETEVAYRASIARERAAKRAADEVRFQVMRARAAAEKAERQAVQQAVKKRKHEEHRGVGRDHAGAGTRAARAK